MHQCNVTTVQRAIHKLKKAGLVIPRDRGGRHRCGTRADDGRAHDVYGFDLSPLIVRAAELRALREETRAATSAHRTMMRSTGSVREQVRAVIISAEDQGLPGDWASIQQRLDDLARRYRSALTKPDRAPIKTTLDERAAVQSELDALHAEALALFKAADRVDNGEDRAAPAACRNPEMQPLGRNFEALTNTNNEIVVSQVELRKAAPAASAPSGHPNKEAGGSDGAFGLTNALGISGSADRAPAQKRKGQASEPPTAKPVISLKALARACPAVKDWCDDDPFRSEGAFLHWSETIKSVVGISDDAWRTARTLHGSWDTAAIAAYVLQRQENGERSGTGKVTQPGGLFRALSDRYSTGNFNLLRSLGHLQIQALGGNRDGKDGNGAKRTGRRRSS
jgi:replication initiation protein RepC